MILRLSPLSSASTLSSLSTRSISQISPRSCLSPRPQSQSHRIQRAAAAEASKRYNSTSTSTPPTRACPTCQRQIPLPLSPCPSCSTLLPLPTSLSHHSMLYLSSPVLASSSSAGSGTGTGLGGQLDLVAELATISAHGYGLDKADLRSKWVRRQRELHPDKYSSKGDKAVDMARELSGRVNEAYNVLGDELKRAEYLLSIHQQGPEETDKIDDPLLLAEILEAREELEDASSPDEIESIRSSNREKVSDLIQSLTTAFSQTPPNLDEAKILAVQLRYWQGLEKAAKERVVE
ncbi:Fe-S protein assembly co-chaperone HscB [Kwoniella newhampshirensis]|uniref:Fe-S protein assembly co-chaperone HscB n=1 Tax=Kwoniella newhampshirensis TaxID=1651941 RepID=A0AAW0YY37_9TREE